MADTGSEIAPPSPDLVEPPRQRRAHTYSRLTTAVAVLALATSIYALVRLDATRDRLDHVNDMAKSIETASSVLDTQIKNLSTRERNARRALDRRLTALDETPKQMEELASSVEELRGRAEGPERAWSRTEAMFLLDLAQRRLTLDRDVETAIVALEAADSRLSSLRDASVTPVRQQIARDLQALRAVRLPDVTGVLARLSSAEEQAMKLPVKGIVATQRNQSDRPLPEGMLARAWSLARNTLTTLIVVRKVDDREGSVITSEEALLRRQHLQLLLFAARTSVARHDGAAYRNALAGARGWLGEFFDLSNPAAQTLMSEIQTLEPIEIDPPLPDISGSSRALRRVMPARRGPE